MSLEEQQAVARSDLINVVLSALRVAPGPELNRAIPTSLLDFQRWLVQTLLDEKLDDFTHICLSTRRTSRVDAEDRCPSCGRKAQTRVAQMGTLPHRDILLCRRCGVVGNYEANSRWNRPDTVSLRNGRLTVNLPLSTDAVVGVRTRTPGGEYHKNMVSNGASEVHVGELEGGLSTLYILIADELELIAFWLVRHVSR